MKQVTSTTLEAKDLRRLRRLAQLESTLTASIVRKCILRSLPEVEREILGRGISAEVVKAEVVA